MSSIFVPDHENQSVNMTSGECLSCGYVGEPYEGTTVTCPKCVGVLHCLNGCQGGTFDEGSDAGRHWFHGLESCGMHDGPCDTPVWCPCPSPVVSESEAQQ